MLFLFADGILFVLIAPFLVLLAVPAVFFVLRDAKRATTPPPWAAAITLSAAIWLLAALVGSKLTLFSNYAAVPILIGIPLTLVIVLRCKYTFGRAQALSLLLLGPVGSVVIFWQPTQEMPGLEILRNLRPIGFPAPPPRRRRSTRR